jgi:hypothetical protein
MYCAAGLDRLLPALPGIGVERPLAAVLAEHDASVV